MLVEFVARSTFELADRAVDAGCAVPAADVAGASLGRAVRVGHVCLRAGDPLALVPERLGHHRPR